jgi:hypothetical protein
MHGRAQIDPFGGALMVTAALWHVQPNQPGLCVQPFLSVGIAP